MANNQILIFLPQAKFWNSVILDPKSTAPAAVEGGLYYNSSDGQLMYGYKVDDSSVIWKAVGADGSWNASVSGDTSYITGISYADGSAALTTRLLPVRSLTAYDVSDGGSSVIAGPNASHDGTLYIIGSYGQDNPLVTKEAVSGIIESRGVSDVKMDTSSVLDPSNHVATLHSDPSHGYSYGGAKDNPLATVGTVLSATDGIWNHRLDASVDVPSNYYINNISLSGTLANPSLSVGTSLLPVVDARINAVGEESAGSSVVDESGIIQLKTKGHYDAANNPLVTFSEVEDLVSALRFKGSMDSSTATFVEALLESSIYLDETPRQGDIVIYGTTEYICRADDPDWPESAADPSYQEEYWEKFGDESNVVTSLGGKKGAIGLDENTLFIDESNTLHVKAEALGSNTYYANIANDANADTVRIEHGLNVSVMNIDVYVNDGSDGSSKRMVFVDSIISDKDTITVGFGSVEAFKGCSEHGYTVVFTAAASPIKIADASVTPVVPVTPTNNE